MLWSQQTPPSPTDTLQRVLPEGLTLRPKVSLKENLSTVFSDLTTYSVDHAPRTDSRNLMNTWTAKNDQQVLQALVLNKELFLSAGALAIKSYFNTRLKLVSAEEPEALWVFFTELSVLFPKNTFWLTYYENQLMQNNFNWSVIENSDWLQTSLIPALTQKKSTATPWNKDFLINLFNLLQIKKNMLLQSKTDAETNLNAGIFWSLLHNIHTIFEMTDPRLNTISLAETLPLQYSYFDFLQKLIPEQEQNPFLLNYLVNATPNSSITIESLFMQTMMTATQQKNLIMNPKLNDRVKSFIALYPSSLTVVLKSNYYRGTERERLSQALNSVFYLRTLLALKSYLNGSSDSTPLSKGQWTTENHFQKSQEFQWHEDLVLALDEVLHLTQLNIYKLSLVDKCFKEKIDTPTCQTWRATFPMKLKEIISENGEKRKIWEVISSTPITLPPGQITMAAHETLRIVAPEINFSYFSRILAPSGVIEIQTNKLTSPWIDVSGQNGFNGFGAQGFPGQKPWIKKGAYCVTRDYLDGVTLRANPRKSGKIDWQGFSIRNPYPKNISVCASDALKDNRDEVGDITKILDLGLPPELVEGVQPRHGDFGGKISIELTPSAEKSFFTNPLLLAMGGDGSNGKVGHDSPLCKQGKYQSFKVVLSHHKQWFLNWIDYSTNATFVMLQLTSRGEYGDHWYGLFEVNLPRTSGSSGGNAGAGGEIELFYNNTNTRVDSRPMRWFISPGVAGLGGKAGSCGPNIAMDGKNGSASAQGKITITKKQIAGNQVKAPTQVTARARTLTTPIPSATQIQAQVPTPTPTLVSAPVLAPTVAPTTAQTQAATQPAQMESQVQAQAIAEPLTNNNPSN